MPNPVMIAGLVIQGIKALTELYALIKAKKVDKEQMGDIGVSIQSIIEKVKAAKKKSG